MSRKSFNTSSRELSRNNFLYPRSRPIKMPTAGKHSPSPPSARIKASLVKRIESNRMSFVSRQNGRNSMLVEKNYLYKTFSGYNSSGQRSRSPPLSKKKYINVTRFPFLSWSIPIISKRVSKLRNSIVVSKRILEMDLLVERIVNRSVSRNSAYRTLVSC